MNAIKMRNGGATKTAHLLKMILFTLCCTLCANSFAEEAPTGGTTASGEGAWSKVTALSMSSGELTDGSQIKIYPYNEDAMDGMALSANLTDKALTSAEKADGGGSVWTLEDAGDGYFYIVNSLGLYWAYQQSNNSRVSMTLTSGKNEAVKVKMVWNEKYPGVAFKNANDDTYLNNLFSSNYCYNWWYGANPLTSDSNSSFHVYLYSTAPALQTMALNANKMTLRKHSSAILKLDYAPADARVSAITVKSSDDSIISVATIVSDNTVAVRVYGCAAGTATITVEALDGSGLTDSCVITVVDTPDNTTETKVSSIDELTAGSTIKIYPYDSSPGFAEMALCSNTANAVLTSTQKASEGSNMWTLEDAGDGYFYLVNGLRQYWAFQKSYDPFVPMKVAASKNEAVKVKMVWNEKYPGVAFKNAKDDTYLNNLRGFNYRYNWYNGDGNPLTYDTNCTYNVYVCHTTSMLDALAFDVENLTLTSDAAVVLNLVYAPADADASVIMVKSSDESVATVTTSTDSNGTMPVTVTGHKAGTVTITASTPDVSVSCLVSVVSESGDDSIDSIVIDGDADAKYFTLDGLKLAGKPQQQGIYIRVQDGKSQKVIVREK